MLTSFVRNEDVTLLVRRRDHDVRRRFNDLESRRRRPALLDFPDCRVSKGCTRSIEGVRVMFAAFLLLAGLFLWATGHLILR